MKKQFILLLLTILIFQIKAVASEDPYFCNKKEDCSYAKCCSTREAINLKFAPNCNVPCLAACDPPYGCGCSEIRCINHKCKVQILESMKSKSYCKVNEKKKLAH